jgi:hypothetical protein
VTVHCNGKNRNELFNIGTLKTKRILQRTCYSIRPYPSSLFSKSITRTSCFIMI